MRSALEITRRLRALGYPAPQFVVASRGHGLRYLVQRRLPGVTERRGETYSTLNEVKPKIAMVLLDYNEDAVVKSFLKQIAKHAKIVFSRTV